MNIQNRKMVLSKLLRNLSCPIMAVGIFGLIQNHHDTWIWWSLIGLGTVIVLFDTFQNEPIKLEPSNKSIKENNNDR